MDKILLSEIELPEGELWMDTGILFPFFNKQVKTNYMLWVQELIVRARNQRLCTTLLVREEINRIFVRWSPKHRKEASGYYRRLFELMEVIPTPGSSEGNLSSTDVSLLNRSGGILITSDKLLYKSDDKPAVLVSLKELDYGYSYKLNAETKNLI